MAALKLFVAAFGTFLLGRALGHALRGALLAGVVFAFGLYFVVWLAWPLTNVFPLIPSLLAVDELRPLAAGRGRWRAWPRWSRCSSSAAIPRRASTDGRRGAVRLRAARLSRGATGAACAAAWPPALAAGTALAARRAAAVARAAARTLATPSAGPGRRPASA